MVSLRASHLDRREGPTRGERNHATTRRGSGVVVSEAAGRCEGLNNYTLSDARGDT